MKKPSGIYRFKKNCVDSAIQRDYLLQCLNCSVNSPMFAVQTMIFSNTSINIINMLQKICNGIIMQHDMLRPSFLMTSLKIFPGRY